MLKIENLTLELGSRKVINNLSLEFKPGHIHAIVGPNGAGKTSLACVIMGMEGYRDYSGSIKFKGDDISGLSIDERARKGITLAWQEPARYEGLKVKDFVLAASKDKSIDKLDEYLMKMGLSCENYMDRAVDKTLSGGERKKIELASLLAMDAELVMLDEPDSGIDVDSLNRIFEAIRLLREKGATIVLITHSLSVLKQADHAFLICSGEIVEEGDISGITPYFENKCIPCPHKNVPEKN